MFLMEPQQKFWIPKLVGWKIWHQSLDFARTLGKTIVSAFLVLNSGGSFCGSIPLEKIYLFCVCPEFFIRKDRKHFISWGCLLWQALLCWSIRMINICVDLKHFEPMDSSDPRNPKETQEVMEMDKATHYFVWTFHTAFHFRFPFWAFLFSFTLFWKLKHWECRGEGVAPKTKWCVAEWICTLLWICTRSYKRLERGSGDTDHH